MYKIVFFGAESINCLPELCEGKVNSKALFCFRLNLLRLLVAKIGYTVSQIHHHRHFVCSLIITSIFCRYYFRFFFSFSHFFHSNFVFEFTYLYSSLPTMPLRLEFRTSRVIIQTGKIVILHFPSQEFQRIFLLQISWYISSCRTL